LKIEEARNMSESEEDPTAKIIGSSTRRVEFDFIDYNSDCAIAQDLQEEVTAYECK
jgi:hypothetical protein